MLHNCRFGMLTLAAATFFWCCTPSEKEQQNTFSASQASSVPVIDGIANEPCWAAAPWYPLNQIWIGDSMNPQDFSGRYKLSWTEDFLYVLAEIRDDTLIDIHPQGLDFYWDDDCLEIFVDEDASGGDHQYNYNAFAYPIALDNQVADIGPDSLPHFYNDHVICKRTTSANTSLWEAAVALYPDSYRDGAPDQKPVKLRRGKTIGFALAYCDNDFSPERENFIGSAFVPGEDKNRGWIDAGIFQPLILK